MAYNKSERAILTTLHYSALFDFPLTYAELWKFLMIDRAIPKNDFKKSLERLYKRKVVLLEDIYYYLPGRKKTVSLRKSRVIPSEKKYKRARTIATILSGIPTVYFIGISGSLAMENAAPDDDIDFFIITQKNTLFITRLLILSLLQMRGVRRKRNETNPKDKICVNLLLDETALSWPLDQRDIYTAHEVVQLIPLFDRQNSYPRFLETNHWALRFFPNYSLRKDTNRSAIRYHKLLRLCAFIPLYFLEPLARSLQLHSINRHRTSEKVGNHRLAFHQNFYRTNFTTELNLNLKKAGLLTKF